MLRRSLRLTGVALAVFALAACQVSISPIPFDPLVSGTFTAEVTTTPTALRSNVQIAQGQTLYFRIEMPTDVRDLLYGEVVGSGLRVGWLSTSGTTLAVSESRRYFAGSVSALALAADVDTSGAIAPRSIDVPFACVGPCAAIAPTTAGSYYLAVRNVSGGSRSFDLYAYSMPANDLEDRGAASNDTPATATQFGLGEVVEGAIELLGDRDWFEYVGSGDPRVLTFTLFDGAEDLGLRLRFEGDDQGVDDLTGLPGSQTAFLYPGDRFQVYSSLGRAGPASTAGYVIQND
ncbi:MAG: hypothetical protein K0A98_16145 [Trueperaceae bacterium]|nr:hypothetical protein [Trueperaceae bacterium]